MATNEQKRKARFGVPFVLGFVLAVLGIGAAAWYYLATQPEPVAVERRDVVSHLALNADIVAPPSARADITVSYPVTADKIYATVGQKVAKGDILVGLYYPSAQAAVTQAQAQVKGAEKAYLEAKSQYDARLKAAQARLDLALKEEQQAQEPSPAESPAQPIGPAPETGSALEQASQTRQQAEWELAGSKAEITAYLASLQEQINSARQMLAAAKQGERAAYLRAPISGTILALNAQPGKTIGTEESRLVATIVDLRALQAQARIEPKQASAVSPGLPVVLTVKEFPDQMFKGEVSLLTTRVVPRFRGLLKRQEYVALIDFTNEAGLIKPDMQAFASIETAVARNVLAVPNEAIGKDREGRPVVKILQNGQWHARAVDIGLRGDRYTEIRLGLNEGQIVQTVPSPLRVS